MKILHWNVNGLRAVLSKNSLLKTKNFTFTDLIKRERPDYICLNEIKILLTTPEQVEKFICEYCPELKKVGYSFHLNSAGRKGYAGTAIFYREKPIKSENGIQGLTKKDDELLNNEGRLITFETKDFYLLSEYTPNYGMELSTDTRSNYKTERVGFREIWEKKRREYIKRLDKTKPLILCGDLNVAAEEIDLKNPKSNMNNPGFTNEEREWFRLLKGAGMVDIFRETYKTKEAYTWFSYRFNARENNAGWRIDYFLCSKRLFKDVKAIKILDDIYGSDHLPVVLEI